MLFWNQDSWFQGLQGPCVGAHMQKSPKFAELCLGPPWFFPQKGPARTSTYNVAAQFWLHCL